MKYRRSIIIMVLAIFIFGVASVCAGDVNETVIASENSQPVELMQSNEMEVVEQTNDEDGNVGTFQELQENITQGYSSGIITLDKDYECEDGFSTEGISITQGITIDGQGHQIDAKGKARIFNIKTDNVILKNITLLNGKSTDGGAINWEANSGGVLDCCFLNNTASDNGGAIYSLNNINVLNSLFGNNKANKSGGAVYIYGAFSNSKINSTFINNSANNGGAIYFNGETSNITINSCFKGNVAERAGGAIFSRGQSKNNNFSCEFHDNNVKQASGGALFFYNLVENNIFESIFKSNFALYGGGIFFYYKANDNKFNGDFIDNTAKSCGGAIFFHNTTNNNNFTGYFFNNSALGEVDETVGNGGAITFKDVSTNCMFTCDFINNTAALNGGGVNYRQTPHNITFNGNFINNTSPSGGGVNFFESFENVIFNGEFIANSAVNGGAIAAKEGIIKDVSFENNHAENGGAVWMNSGSVLNCNFTGNSADWGGAIITDSGSVNSCNFVNNYAGHGGAVYFYVGGNLADCNFTNNKASGKGGAVYIDEGFSNSKINSTFINNSAYQGGAIFFNNETGGIVIGGYFEGNVAERIGGAICFQDKSFDNVISAEFYNNRADYASGGAIFFRNIAENNLFEGSFTNNYAVNGGAIFFYNKANNNRFNSDFLFNLANSSGGVMVFYDTSDNNNFTGCFINNSALGGQTDEMSGNGGAITFRDVSSNSLFTCDFINNTAAEHGGAVNYRQTPHNITFNGNFVDNGAKYGGGINFIESFGNVTLNSEFIGNVANQGGAIYINGSVSNSIINSTFINNSAYQGGAVFFNNETGGIVIDGYFEGNVAERIGGAICFQNRSCDNVISAEFNNNRVNGASGGAIFFRDIAENNLFDGSFINNYAINGGAIFFYNKANNNRFNSDFLFNLANSSGGVMVFYDTSDNNNFTGCFINNSALGGQTDEMSGNGGAITFKNTSSNSIFTCDFINNTAAEHGGAVNYRQTPYNIIFNGNFINNTSPNGGGVNFFESFENVIFNSEFIGNSAVNGGAIAALEGIIKNALFKDNSAETGGAVYFIESCEIMNCNFTDNKATGDCGSGGAIFMGSGNVTNCDFTNNEAIDFGGSGGAIFMGSGNVTNCKFSNNSAVFSGAIESYGTTNVNNCNFINNNAAIDGGALWLNSSIVENSNFTNNNVPDNGYGGAIYFAGNGTVINCNFNGNEANMGSAIYFRPEAESINRTISHSTFLNNRANANYKTPFDVTINGSSVEIIFMGNNNLLNAIYSSKNCEVSITNVTYWGANGIENTGASTIVPAISDKEAGQNITITAIVNDNVISTVKVTDADGKIVLEDVSGDYCIHIRHDSDSYYTSAETIFTNMEFQVNVTEINSTNRTVNITAKSNIKNDVVQGKLLFILPDGSEINSTYETDGTWWALHTFEKYGEYKINASYIGLDNVTINSGNITITKANSTITLDDIVLEYGDSLNVTVTTEGATGITAKIDENNVDVINNFTIPIFGLGAGNYTLKLTAIADSDHNSVNKTVKITVNKAGTDITLTNETLDLKIHDVISDFAQLTPDDAGTLDYMSSNDDVAKIEDGKIVAVGTGSAIITVSFEGNDNYTAAENKTILVTVIEGPFVFAPNVTKYYKGSERFVVTVTDSDDIHLANQSVSITINGVSYNRTTDMNGTASMAIGLRSGQYNVTVTACNSTVYSTVTVLPTVNATDVVKFFRNGTQFYATFKDTQGNYLANGTTVGFNVNGVIYERKVSGDEGIAKLSINLGQGEYIITSTNPENGENLANNITVLPIIIENDDLTKYYRNATQYAVKVIDDNGNVVGAGETVTFNINGALYDRKTNESGIAKLNINLQPGDYVISAQYNKCTVSNNIKVLPVLSADDLTKKYGTSGQFVTTLIDGQGNPYAEQKIQFNVNGILYYRVTDSNGQAKLNINLQPGKYIITSTYNGTSISNSITISD